jgi:Bacterial RNA polymerase, alpha chain C terminal domain
MTSLDSDIQAPPYPVVSLLPLAREIPTTMDDVLKDYRYALPVQALGLSSWALRALIHDNLAFVGQIVEKTETELLGIPNFGQKSLDEVKIILKNIGLHLSTLIVDRPDNETFVTVLKRRSVEAATHNEISQMRVLLRNANVVEMSTATVTALPNESFPAAFKRMGKLLNGVVERLPDKNFMVELEALVRKYDRGPVLDNGV